MFTDMKIVLSLSDKVLAVINRGNFDTFRDYRKHRDELVNSFKAKGINTYFKK